VHLINCSSSSRANELAVLLGLLSITQYLWRENLLCTREKLPKKEEGAAAAMREVIHYTCRFLTPVESDAHDTADS
jgi:hypothetical protein